MRNRLLQCILMLAAMLVIAIPAFAGQNLAALPGGPADYSAKLVYNSTNANVMWEQSAKGRNYVHMKVAAEPGKTFVLTPRGQRAQVSITDDPAKIRVGLGKNPPDRQSFGRIIVADWLQGECGVEWRDIYWKPGTTLGFWFPAQIMNPKTGRWLGNWTEPNYCMWVPWYSNYFYEHGTDVWLYAKRGLDGKIYPLGHGRPLDPDLKDTCFASN
jgi:hypothetical protein